MAILFQPGDGTGSNQVPNDLSVPNHYQSYIHKIVPRPKKDIYREVFFPLLSVRKDTVHPYLNSISELTIQHNRLVQLCQQGVDCKSFVRMLHEERRAEPRITVTVGNYHGNRFGDPHSCYALPTHFGTYQIPAFLTIKSNDDPLIELLNGKVHHPIFWEEKHLNQSSAYHER